MYPALAVGCNRRRQCITEHAIASVLDGAFRLGQALLPLIKSGGLVLDLAAGSGRHVRLLRDCRFAVCAVDRDTTALLAFAGPRCEVRRIDLETNDLWQLGGGYDGIIVTS